MHNLVDPKDSDCVTYRDATEVLSGRIRHNQRSKVRVITEIRYINEMRLNSKEQLSLESAISNLT